MLRQLVTIESAQDPVVSIQGTEKIVFCSNNYLNLATDERLTDAVAEAVKKFGTSSGASRLLSGTMKLHVELERSFADFSEQKQPCISPPAGLLTRLLSQPLGKRTISYSSTNLTTPRSSTPQDRDAHNTAPSKRQNRTSSKSTWPILLMSENSS